MLSQQESIVLCIQHHLTDKCCFCCPLQTHQQSQRALLLQGSEYLNNASQSIERSHRIAVETEQIGTDIIEELGEQREQLDRTKDRVSGKKSCPQMGGACFSLL